MLDSKDLRLLHRPSDSPLDLPIRHYLNNPPSSPGFLFSSRKKKSNATSPTSRQTLRKKKKPFLRTKAAPRDLRIMAMMSSKPSSSSNNHHQSTMVPAVRARIEASCYATSKSSPTGIQAFHYSSTGADGKSLFSSPLPQDQSC